MRKLTAALAALLILTGCSGKLPPNTVSSPEDVYGKKIGVLYGSAAAVYAMGAGEAFTYRSGESMMGDLKSGAVDCALMDSAAAKPLIRKTSSVKLLDEPFLSVGLSAAVAKENLDLKKAVNDALAALATNKVVADIISGYTADSKFRYISPKNITRSGTLRVAVPSDFPPYSYKGADGNAIGIDIDVAQAVCDLLGAELELVETPMDELVTSVLYGRADLALGGLYADAGGDVDYTASYCELSLSVIVRK